MTPNVTGKPVVGLGMKPTTPSQGALPMSYPGPYIYILFHFLTLIFKQ